ncbi:hypothetical protein K438DRAFT_1643528, partial [Mycena galopus ATCC 62051]
LTRRKFLQCCNAIWAAHNIPTITGHSFRTGGTTELLLAGVNPDVVQAMGRWLSDAFLVYWRHLDLLTPLHAEYNLLTIVLLDNIQPLPHISGSCVGAAACAAGLAFSARGWASPLHAFLFPASESRHIETEHPNHPHTPGNSFVILADHPASSTGPKERKSQRLPKEVIGGW